MVFETAGSELTEAIPPEDFTAYLCAVITRKIPKSNTKKNYNLKKLWNYGTEVKKMNKKVFLYE